MDTLRDQDTIMEDAKEQHSVSNEPRVGMYTVDSMDAGYIAKPKKPFTTWSAMSLGYSISNAGIGMVLVVGSTVFGAGPLFIYGTILVTFVTFCVAITLGELSSAYPHAGGQYYWTAQLAPESSRRFLSYITAILSWASVVCTGASATAGMVNTVFAIIAIAYPDFVYKQWMGFLLYQAFALTAALPSLFERIIPSVSAAFVNISLVTITATFICLLAPNSEKASAALVFGVEGYYNVSGWPDGLAFFIGISGINWGFSCLDAATHLAEEIPEPRKNIPKALLWTVILACSQGLLINTTIFFVATDLDNTTSILGILYTIYNGNVVCASVIGAFIALSVFGAIIGVHTWQSRIVWSLSRDKGFPFHSRMSQLAGSPFYTPTWAILWGACWMSLCGFLFLGSTVAFNSFISAGIVLQYITYATPAALLLIKGRSTFPLGPFWWPRFGPVANVVVICWSALITLFYSLPLFLPVEAGSMNYLACVLVFAFLYAWAYWGLYGAKHYRLVDLRAILD